MILNEHLFTDTLELQTALTERIFGTLSKAVVDDGHATIALPGGSTPVPLFQALARESFDWSNITITLTDERWVETSHPDSNENQLRTHLLDHCNAGFVPLKSNFCTAEEGQAETERKLQHIHLPMNICLLGMGEDGHIASLFPDAPELSSAVNRDSSQRCIAINPPNAKQQRITLTLNALLNTKQIILLIKGDQKRKIYLQAKESTRDILFPVAHILHQSNAPIDVYWSA